MFILSFLPGEYLMGIEYFFYLVNAKSANNAKNKFQNLLDLSGSIFFKYAIQLYIRPLDSLVV